MQIMGFPDFNLRRVKKKDKGEGGKLSFAFLLFRFTQLVIPSHTLLFATASTHYFIALLLPAFS
jgi:hypothetical protein